MIDSPMPHQLPNYYSPSAPPEYHTLLQQYQQVNSNTLPNREYPNDDHIVNASDVSVNVTTGSDNHTDDSSQAPPPPYDEVIGNFDRYVHNIDSNPPVTGNTQATRDHVHSHFHDS